jgi:hypothetical protein
MSIVRFVVVLVAVMLPAAGCGLLFSRKEQPGPGAETSNSVLVEVESHNWNDITVYLLSGGLPERLGMVTALGGATFDFSSHHLNSSTGIRLRALPVAGHAFTTETILVFPGQVITWTLENNLEASSHSVY